jgi:hypothetical protein
VSTCAVAKEYLAEFQPDDDDFEIVPRAPEHDGDEWDVEDEDQDEVKRKIIQGELATSDTLGKR